MDIPNLNSQASQVNQSKPVTTNKFLVPAIIIVVAVVSGFGLSRIIPTNTPVTNLNPTTSGGDTSQKVISADDIDSKEDIKVGEIYGNSDKVYQDSATGTVEAGSINGEGTHILNREGGKDQRAALTSSALDLDLFVGKKVEVKGETNSSKKAGWLLDVGSIKVLE